MYRFPLSTSSGELGGESSGASLLVIKLGEGDPSVSASSCICLSVLRYDDIYVLRHYSRRRLESQHDCDFVAKDNASKFSKHQSQQNHRRHTTQAFHCDPCVAHCKEK